MVKIRENPIKLDELGGKTTPIFGSTPNKTRRLDREALQELRGLVGRLAYQKGTAKNLVEPPGKPQQKNMLKVWGWW